MSLKLKVTPNKAFCEKLIMRNLELVTMAIHGYSLVVLEDVIDDQKLDKPNAKMSEDAAFFHSKCENRP